MDSAVWRIVVQQIGQRLPGEITRFGNGHGAQESVFQGEARAFQGENHGRSRLKTHGQRAWAHFDGNSRSFCRNHDFFDLLAGNQEQLMTRCDLSAAGFNFTTQRHIVRHIELKVFYLVVGQTVFRT